MDVIAPVAVGFLLSDDISAEEDVVRPIGTDLLTDTIAVRVINVSGRTKIDRTNAILGVKDVAIDAIG
jgi:hypothetical protein